MIQRIEALEMLVWRRMEAGQRGRLTKRCCQWWEKRDNWWKGFFKNRKDMWKQVVEAGIGGKRLGEGKECACWVN